MGELSCKGVRVPWLVGVSIKPGDVGGWFMDDGDIPIFKFPFIIELVAVFYLKENYLKLVTQIWLCFTVTRNI